MDISYDESQDESQAGVAAEVAADPAVALAQVIALMIQWGLRRDDVEHILYGAVTVGELRPRAILYEQDAPVTHVYLLTSGSLYQDRISAAAGSRRRVSLRREVGAGQLVGAYALLYGRKHSTRTRAVEFCRYAAIDATALERLLYAFPELRKRIAPVDVMGRLRTVPLFRNLELTTLAYVAEAARQVHLQPDEAVYAEDAIADHIFIVNQGQIRLTWPDGAAMWLGNGMGFGVLNAPLPDPAHAEDERYGHWAHAVGEADVFVWPRLTLVELTNVDPERAERDLRDRRIEAIDATAPFAGFTPEQRHRLLGYMSHYHVPIPHLLMQQGETGDSLWILMPGSQAMLRALEDGHALQPARVYGPNFFSELALKVDHPLESTVQAEAGSQWLRLHNEDFRTFLDDAGPHLMERLNLGPAAERFLGRTQARRRYSWLSPGENLVLLQRRHAIVLLRKTAISFVLFTFLALVYTLFLLRGWTTLWHIGVLGVFTAVAAGQLLWSIIDYLNDYILVTNQRLVHQEKVLFIAEWRQAAFLEQIRGVDVKLTFFGNLLNYGNLHIQTAAAAGSIRFDFVPNAHNIRRTILEQQGLRQLHYQASSKMIIQNLLEQRLGLRLHMPVRVTAGRVVEEPERSWMRRTLERLRPAQPSQPTSLDLIVWRKHWLILLGRVASPATILIFILLLLAGQRFLPESLNAVVAAVDIVLAVFGLGAAAWFAWNVADWRNDTYEVDYKQIADVEKKPLFFAENRRSALLGEIENIEVSMPSPINFLFGFGNVRLQTAATEGMFTFDWVPNPRGVSEEIRRRIELYRQQQEATRAHQRSQELPDWFEMYDRLGGDDLGGDGSTLGEPNGNAR